MALDKAKHVRYWRMNANVLPDHYISTDSSRMTLGFFTVAALDLLGVLDAVPSDTRQAWTAWIYSCQTAGGGFRGFTGANLGDFTSPDNHQWDPATIPATFFALVALLVLGDDLARVDRDGCMTWLPKLQRTDGSFGEVLTDHDGIEGGQDLRFCCCAAGIAFILQGHDVPRRPVIDEDALVRYIQSCQCYNGGFGESPLSEPHAGLTYCAVAALAFVQRLRGKESDGVRQLIPRYESCVRWMVERQTTLLEEDAEEAEEDSGEGEGEGEGKDEDEVNNEPRSRRIFPHVTPGTRLIAGLNGRDNKVADTCYCWWNTGALAILHNEALIDVEAMRKYLLEKVQHLVGGFGKGIGAPPDVLHSYLGLAALALFKGDDIKPMDATMCVSQDAANALEKVVWKQR